MATPQPVCPEFPDYGYNLIKAFCPKSCNACDEHINVKEIGDKVNTAYCNRDQAPEPAPPPPPVSFSLAGSK